MKLVSSGQAEEAFRMELVTDVTLFKQLIKNIRFMELLQSSSIAQQGQEHLPLSKHGEAQFHVSTISPKGKEHSHAGESYQAPKENLSVHEHMAESIHQAYLCHQASFPLLNDGQTPISGPSRAHSGPGNGGQGFGSEDPALVRNQEGQAHSKAPEDFSQGGKPSVILPASQIAKTEKDLEARAVIGLLAGPRPPAETLKGWIKQQWGSRGVILETIQSLPKNHYLFVFQTPEMAFDIISMGPWLIRSSPLLLSRWNKHFNPEESAQKHYPVWVEFPNLPLHYHQHLKMIASKLGNVLGGRPRREFNPAWHPQVLVEMDISVPLPPAIDIFTDDGQGFEQPLVYKYLPKACFLCGVEGHFVRNCPIKNPAPSPSPVPPPQTAAPAHSVTAPPQPSQVPPSQPLPSRAPPASGRKPDPRPPNRFAVLASLSEFADSSDSDNDCVQPTPVAPSPSSLEQQVNALDNSLKNDQNKENAPVGPSSSALVPYSNPTPMEILKDNKRNHANVSQTPPRPDSAGKRPQRSIK
ncbi:hypothetical protein L7F22_040525 [Adiantum nelumboides]|nr:hypothetical protein [Adiantum nelumboides]